MTCPLCGSHFSSCFRCGAFMCQNRNCSAGHRCAGRALRVMNPTCKPTCERSAYGPASL